MDEWERERWRGEIDAELKSVKENVREMRICSKKDEDALGDLKLVVKGLTTKMTAYAALGAFLGGGVMSFIVGLVLKQ